MSNLHYYTLFLDPQEFAYATGLVFRGLTVSEGTGHRWNIIARAWRGADPVYAMVGHDDVREGLDVLARILADRSGATAWSFDKYAR